MAYVDTDQGSDEALDRLREQIAERPLGPYLLTVTDTNEPHCSPVLVDWDAARLLVAAPSSWPGSAARGYLRVSLVWPPAEPGGYTLIVDGTAVPDDAATLAVSPTRAVLHRRGRAELHRRGRAEPGAASACGADCVPILHT